MTQRKNRIENKYFKNMSNTSLENTELNDDEDSSSNEEEEESSNFEEDAGVEDDEFPYDIDVERALSIDIAGDKKSPPEKIDKAVRLGFNIPVTPDFNPEKPPVSI